MNTEVIVSCAVTGGTEPVAHRPKTPAEIAAAVLEAAEAGAAIAHIHVRTEDDKATMALDRFEKTVALVNALGMADRVLISSFNHRYIERVKAANPQMATAARAGPLPASGGGGSSGISSSEPICIAEWSMPCLSCEGVSPWFI